MFDQEVDGRVRYIIGYGAIGTWYWLPSNRRVELWLLLYVVNSAGNMIRYLR